MLLSTLLIIILWTWSITPLWVNIVGTCLLAICLAIQVGESVFKAYHKWSRDN